jgi:hypothetical protein
MPDEYITATEARKRLEITEYMLAKLLREGTLPWTPDPYNKNAKLVKVSDVERLKELRLREPPRKRRPQEPNEDVPKEYIPIVA